MKRHRTAGSLIRRRKRELTASVGFLLTMLVSACASSQEASPACTTQGPEAAMTAARAFSVRDSIEMTRLSTPGLDASAFVWSPGNSAVAFVLRRGDLEANEVEYVIAWYRRQDLEQAAERGECGWRVAATFRSSDNFEGVRRIKWLDDGDTLAALAKAGDGSQQLYRIHLPEGRVEQITEHPEQILLFDMVGDRFVFVANAMNGGSRQDEEWQRGFALDPEMPISEIYNIPSDPPPGSGSLEIFTGDATGDEPPSRVATGPVDAVQPLRGIWLAPDGHHAVTVLPARRIPESWEGYRVPVAGFGLKATGPGEAVGHTAWQYVLLDLEAGTVRQRLDAPAGWHLGFRAPMTAYWAADSRTVVFTNTWLPLDVADQEDYEQRTAAAAVAGFDLETGALWRIATLPPSRQGRVTEVSWDAAGAVFSLQVQTADGETRTQVLDAITGREISGEPPAPEGGGMELTIAESLNDPPMLSLRTADGGTQVLADLNPHWASLRMPSARTFEWTDETGHEWQGVLVAPVDVEPGRRYPLVIQTHGVTPGAFIVDGPIPGVTTAAYAARPLAAEGVYVLQMEDRGDVIMTPEEAPAHLRGYLGAIRTLDEQGLIDTARVGLIGFSRTCYHVKYALAFSDFPFAAATAADGVDMGYLQYTLYHLRNPAIRREYEAVNGGIPVGEDLDHWMDRAPPFSAHKVDTPLRMEALGAESVISQWEMYALLKRLGKPVEMIYIPGGIHNLVKPWERLTSQQGNVDWFTYWLMDKKDADPDKAEQYRRWDHLRDSAGAEP